MYKTKFYYNSDVWDIVMILYVICQLVCVIDSWAHTSFVHSILSLKLGVTLAPLFHVVKKHLLVFIAYSISQVTKSWL